jgi:hypothetical protein
MKKIITSLLIINSMALAGMNEDMEYRNGQNFVVKYYNYGDFAKMAGNRNAYDACEYLYSTFADSSNSKYPSQDWLDGCAYALKAKRGW